MNREVIFNTLLPREMWVFCVVFVIVFEQTGSCCDVSKNNIGLREHDEKIALRMEREREREREQRGK